jgi:hypothetical protein
MVRLSQYMGELAQMLGEPAAVHFVRLRPGSLVIVHKVEREALPKVRARTQAVRRGDAPQDAMRSYKAVNRMLREDNGVGILKSVKEKGALILKFPGREETEEQFAAVRQFGSIDGILLRVGGADQTAHIMLEVEDGQISGLYTTRAIAKELAHRIYEPVRLFGRGRWNRDSEGVWRLIDLKVDSFEPLEDVPLSRALTELRAIPTGWGDDAYKELGVIRHGVRGKKNGGS